MKRQLVLLMLLMAALTMQGQSVVSGVVTDRETGRPLQSVSISAEGSHAHTVTNSDGRFTLKVDKVPRYIQMSHIGYKTRRQQLTPGNMENLQLTMLSSPVMLNEVLVTVGDPLEIVKAAMARIPDNYPLETELVRCFYRETVQRGSRFIAVAEAVTDLYKTSYLQGVARDAVGIMKGRRLMSMNAKDTLGVKIQGGPVMPVVADVAKNRDYLLDPELLPYYSFQLLPATKIDDCLHYVVQMTPRTATLAALLGGKLYINQETLAITRAELQLDVSDWRKASEYMLVKKPMGLRFRPKELSVTVAYETDASGITHIRYVSNKLRFNCDWKRRLFAHTFTAVSEMVVTDRLQQGKGIKRPSGRSSFGISDRFYDRVEYFDDPDFWADYNIIQPTESLENAIDKLKKRIRD